MHMTTRNALCCITSTLLLVLFESEVNMTTTKILLHDEDDAATRDAGRAGTPGERQPHWFI